MPTYGRIETVKDYPLNPDLAVCQREIKQLQKKVQNIISACDHHFVPPENTLSRLRKTQKPEVYDAGRISEVGGMSNVTFALDCSKCSFGLLTRLTEHCPVCASPTVGDWGLHKDRETYFGSSNLSYLGVWFISCLNCDFKAAGLRWDK